MSLSASYVPKSACKSRLTYYLHTSIKASISISPFLIKRGKLVRSMICQVLYMYVEKSHGAQIRWFTLRSGQHLNIPSP